MNKRLHVLDALRGFAIVSIMILHNIGHFDFVYKPDNLPDWMIQLDEVVAKSVSFLFSGKSFGIFALLFGVSFFIQFNNQAIKGNDFRLRFAWRMFLLFIIGLINSAFFMGDILMIYAALGVFLIPLAKLPSKALIVIALVLLFQPLELIHLIKLISNPEIEVSPPEQMMIYFDKTYEYITNGSFWDTVKGNIINGRKAILLWNFYVGRYFQILSLFIFGVVLGRQKLFEWSKSTKKIWLKILILSVLLFILLYIISKNMEGIINSIAIRDSILKIWKPLTKLSFMMIMVSSFTLLFHTQYLCKLLNVFSPVGKMSLSNYVFQSIVGTFIYYGFGLGLYKYTGATYSFLIGIVLSILFIIASTQWNKRFRYGPLEGIWHKLTWIDLSK